MKLNASGFESFLKDKSSGYVAALVYGPDQGLARESAARIQKKWVSQNDPFGETVFGSGEVPETLIDELNAYGFGATERLVEVRDPDRTDVKTLVDTLAVLQQQLEPPVAKLLVTAGELSPSSPLRKAFEAPKAKQVLAFACYADRDGDVARMVRQTLEAEGHRTDPAAIALFVENVPRDRAILRNELEKLCLYLKDQPNTLVGPELVRTLVCQDGDVGFDDVALFCADGDMGQADAALNRALDAGQLPAVLIRGISRHFLRLHQVVRAMERGEPADSAISALRPPVFIMQKARFLGQTRRWSVSRLETVLSQSLETERELKSTSASPNSVLSRFVLRACSLAR